MVGHDVVVNKPLPKFRKTVPWLAGIACFILISIQIITNLTAVHTDQSGLLMEDPPDYPDLPQPTKPLPASDRNLTTASILSPLRKDQETINNFTAHNFQQENLWIQEDVEHQEQPLSDVTNTEAEADNTDNDNLTTLWSIETSYLYTSPQYGQIRRWGCRLSTVPFIFVHIGKTGGGTIRARLAAASLNYTKKEFRHQDFSYYPLKKRRVTSSQSSQHRRLRRRSKYDDEDRAQFCHTGFHMFKPQPLRNKNFRRSLQCNATTPLGQALACPEIFHHAYDPNRTRIMDAVQKFHNPNAVLNPRNMSNETLIRFHNRNALRYRRHPCFIPPDSDHAHIVFAGHHNLGSEMHWLPAGMLSEWWNTMWASSTAKETTTTTTQAVTTQKEAVSHTAEDRVAQRLQVLHAHFDLSPFPNHYGDPRDSPNHDGWCHGRPRPMFAYEDTAAYHQSCSEELYQSMDELAIEAVRQRMSNINTTDQPIQNNTATATAAATTNTSATPATTTTTTESSEKLALARYWSTMYASLPVLRVTILRDPFSWLCSKFFWHRVDKLFNATCDDAAIAIEGDWLSIKNKQRPQGWARRMALLYLEQICGDDCVVRSYYSTENMLQEIELQATANLRQAFAVVGILPDLDEFYDLLNRRTYYLNTSLNAHVEGLRHGSFSADPEETVRCKKQFQNNQTFRELLLQAPEIAALQRVYEVGLEVNRFQRMELDQC